MTTYEAKMFNMVSQNAHWLTGYAYTSAFILFHVPTWLWYVIPFYIALTAWKEFWYDNKYETPAIRGSSTQDFIFYQIGWVGALVLYFISKI